MKPLGERGGAFRLLMLGEDSLFREGLRRLLEDLPYQIEIEQVIEPAAMADGSGQRFDLVFLGVLPLNVDYAAAVQSAKAAVGADTPVAVLSLVDAPSAVRAAIAAGAAGYVPVMSPPRVIRHAVELIISGGIYLPTSVLGHMDDDHAGRSNGTVQARLTRRQQVVLGELAKGHSNKQIAGTLGLSEATIKVHVAGIMRTLKATNRTQAVITATDAGLLPESIG
jgi:DNA-binding NarL/FixJ family response regulator